jgi:N-acetyl-anhydromuramyl-L-alanine amidase AmpD
MATTNLAIHCTATREGQDIDATTVDGWHLKQGWAGIGYHYLIHLDGSIESGRPEGAIGSHIAGHNANSIGIVYVGGLDSQGRPKDTRTPEQKAAMAQLVRHLDAKYRFKRIGGHRDYSPDKDRDGAIEPFEWLKACPSFDVTAWLKAERIR